MIRPTSEIPRGMATTVLAIRGHYYTERGPVTKFLLCDGRPEHKSCEYPNGYPIEPLRWLSDVSAWINEDDIRTLVKEFFNGT